MKLVDQRTELTIPYPSSIPRSRGINAVNKFTGQMKIDCQPAEVEIINAACEQLGMTRSSFVRWVATYAAKDIMRVYEQPSEPVQAA